MELARLTPENITAIPDDVRAVLGVHPGDDLSWEIERGVAVVRSRKPGDPPPGATVLDSRVFAEWLTDEDDDLF